MPKIQLTSRSFFLAKEPCSKANHAQLLDKENSSTVKGRETCRPYTREGKFIKENLLMCMGLYRVHR